MQSTIDIKSRKTREFQEYFLTELKGCSPFYKDEILEIIVPFSSYPRTIIMANRKSQKNTSKAYQTLKIKSIIGHIKYLLNDLECSLLFFSSTNSDTSLLIRIMINNPDAIYKRIKKINQIELGSYKNNERIKYYYKFPDGMRWENISIAFLNREDVYIQIDGSTRRMGYKTKYDEMGFKDGRRNTPNKQWVFLRGLSETDGELTWKTPMATEKGKKQKQLLSNTLKAYFQIYNESPFYTYRTEKAYKIKIELAPEEDAKDLINNDGEPKNFYEDESDISEIEKFRKEQVPEVFEETLD